MGSACSDAKTVVNEKEVNTTKKKSSAKGASPDQNPNSMGNTTNGSQQTNPPNSDKDQNAANKTNSAEMTNPNQQSSSPNENVVQPYEKNENKKEEEKEFDCGQCCKDTGSCLCEGCKCLMCILDIVSMCQGERPKFQRHY